tara:strand:+ start:137 stop:355 length:219 start_codon:yes stop_codon:yes gene_type:complete
MKIEDMNKYGERQNYSLYVRLTKTQKETLKLFAESSGFNTVSSYVRFTLFNPTFEMKLNRIIELLKNLEKKK